MQRDKQKYDALRESDLSKAAVRKSKSKNEAVQAAIKAGTPLYALMQYDEVAVDETSSIYIGVACMRVCMHSVLCFCIIEWKWERR